MRVAVDTLPLQKRCANTGTYNYGVQVLQRCQDILEHSNRGIELHGFVTPQNGFSPEGARLFSHLHTTRMLSRRNLWRLGGMGFSTLLVRPDLIFLPSALGAIPGPIAPVVATILDAMAVRLPPKLVGGCGRVHFLTWVAAKRATRIITISQWSKKELVEIYGLDPRKVDVTYLGYNKELYNDAPPDPAASVELMCRLGVRKPFILHHGAVQLRKNVQLLIQSWAKVRDTFRECDAQLVLAGGLGHGHQEILRVRESSRYREEIILAGVLPDAEQALLIKNATLCVIPSLYEGFCLPMVEAMACGVPTLASRGSCLPEISGGELQYFDPYSIEEMAQAIIKGLEDSGLRNNLRQRGIARAGYFSWERCAEGTLRILEKAASEDGRFER